MTNELFDLLAASLPGHRPATSARRLRGDLRGKAIAPVDPRWSSPRAVEPDKRVRQTSSAESSRSSRRSRATLPSTSEYTSSATHRIAHEGDLHRQTVTLAERQPGSLQQECCGSSSRAARRCSCIALGMLLLNRDEASTPKRTRHPARRRESAAARSDRRRRARRAALRRGRLRQTRSARLLDRTLGLVCVHAGWPLGHLWCVTEAGGSSRPVSGTARSLAAIAVFRKATAELEHAAARHASRTRRRRRATPVWIDKIK